MNHGLLHAEKLYKNTSAQTNCHFLTLSVPSPRSGAKSGRSVQSSLLSEDLMLPDEAVYSKYDDAIAMMDVEIDTAVATDAAGAGKSSDSPGVR